MELTQTLLALAAATSWDGGDGVVSTLRDALAAAAPFDAGELALSMPTGFRRWTFTQDEEMLAADDLLLELCHRDTPLRFDQPDEVAPFPDTAARWRRRGFQSALGLPLGAAGGPDLPRRAGQGRDRSATRWADSRASCWPAWTTSHRAARGGC